ncbi:MAG: hypothetical protein M1830_008864, partial [Pleopsidium flavum]
MEAPSEPELPRKRQKIANTMDNGQLHDEAERRHEEQSASTEVSKTPSTADVQLQKEADVGITEFVSPDLPGFTGILKKRSIQDMVKISTYTDFLVNEILPSGQVIHLENLKAPAPSKQAEHSTQTGTGSSAPVKQPQEAQKDPLELVSSQSTQAQIPERTEPTGKANDEPQTFELSPDDEALLASFFGVEVMSLVVALHNKILRRPIAKPREHGTVKSAIITNRELRTKIHQEMRRIFSSRLETSTDNDGAMIISAASVRNSWGTKPNGGAQERQTQRKGKLGWQDLGGEYLHFS